MSRYNTSNANTNSVLTNLTQTMRTQAETKYKAEIKQHHSLCKTAAKRLTPSDAAGLEHVLMLQTGANDNNNNNNNNNSKDNKKDAAILSEQQVRAFLTEQRDRLRALASDNVQDDRTVDCFVKALQALPQQDSNSNNNNDDNNNTNKTNLDYYETKIRQLMQQAAAANNNHALDMEQETWYREICQELGVPLAAAAKRRSNNGNDDDDDDDDDDIEVMVNTSQQHTSEFKCPFTAQLLQEPVKSKLCGHVYSKQAVTQYIRTGNRKCPAVGCNNHQLNLSQLEADPEKETLVRRFRRRQELIASQQQQLLASQAEGLVDSDDEEY